MDATTSCTYRVVVERTDRIQYLVEATSPEDAESRYLDGEEDWSTTRDVTVVSVSPDAGVPE